MHWLTVISLLIILPNVKTNNNYDVIVLGAGMAGLGAVKQLKDYGITNFTVLEGNDYIGGRVKNVEFENASLPLGAGWVHLHEYNHIMVQLMNKYNMSRFHDALDITSYPVWNRKTGTAYPAANVAQYLQGYYAYLQQGDARFKSRMMTGGSDINLASALRWGGWEAVDELALLMEYYSIDFSSAMSPDSIGAAAFLQRKSGQDWIVTDPRSYIYPAMQEIQGFENKIKLNETVTRIKKNSHQDYTVYTDNGMEWNAKHVLVTFSSGVLNSDKVTFDPVLPAWKKESLSLVPMGYLCKVFAQFSTKFWSDSYYFYTTAADRNGYFVWQDISNIFNVSNVLIAFVAGKPCRNLGKYNDTEITEQIYNVLKDVYPSATKPDKIFRNTFNNDPKFMGSYSYPTTGLGINDYRALEHPVDQGLWFAGEYTGRTESSYAHTAYKSGIDVVQFMVDCMVNGNCPSNEPQRDPLCPNITNATNSTNTDRNDHDNSIIHQISIVQILFVTFIAMLFIK